MSKDWTGYPFGGYDGSDESFEKLLDQNRVECGDCGGELRTERDVVGRNEDGTPYSWDVRKVHADDGSPQCMGRRDAIRRKPGHFGCMECGQPPDEDHLRKCIDPSGKSGGKVGTVQVGPFEVDLSPAAEGPAWEFPHPQDVEPTAQQSEAAPDTWIVNAGPCPHSDADGNRITCSEAEAAGPKLQHTVSCRNCQAEIHLLGGAQFGEVPDDTPWVDWGESVYCSGTELPHTPQWSGEQMQRDFEVSGFSMLMCVVTRRADGKLGSLLFDHAPRFYFGWQEHRP